MLNEPSRTRTRWVRWPAITLPKLSRNGLAIAATMSKMSKVRTARSSHCSMRTRRWFLRIAAIRNCIAAHGISRNLRRLSRWMTIGIEAAASPASSPGLANSSAHKSGSDDGKNMRLVSRSGSPGQSHGARRSRGQVARQRALEALIGAQRNIVDVDHPAARLELVKKGAQLGEDLGQTLQAPKQRGFPERELDLRRVEHVEDDDLVPAVAEVLEPGHDPGRIIEEVGEDGHHPPLLEPFRQVVQYRTHVRFLACGSHVEHVEELLEVRWLAGRTQVAADGVVEETQADRVLLLNDHVGQCRDDELSVLELGDVLARGVRHRFAGVQKQVEEQVRLLLVLLEVKLVGLGPDLPVHVADVVARHIFAVLGELDGEAVVGAGMHARDVALDHEPGLEIEPLEASQCLRI